MVLEHNRFHLTTLHKRVEFCCLNVKEKIAGFIKLSLLLKGMKCPKCNAQMENQRTPANNVIFHSWQCNKCGFKEKNEFNHD